MAFVSFSLSLWRKCLLPRVIYVYNQRGHTVKRHYFKRHLVIKKHYVWKTIICLFLWWLMTMNVLYFYNNTVCNISSSMIKVWLILTASRSLQRLNGNLNAKATRKFYFVSYHMFYLWRPEVKVKWTDFFSAYDSDAQSVFRTIVDAILNFGTK